MTGFISFVDTMSCAKIYSMEFHAKDVVNDFKKIANSEGLMLLKSSDGEDYCAEHESASPDFTCGKKYPEVFEVIKYSRFSEAATLYMNHVNNGLLYTSPYDGTPLVSNTPVAGHIYIESSKGSPFSVIALHKDGQVVSHLRLPVSLP